jgi:hypothetical protein
LYKPSRTGQQARWLTCAGIGTHSQTTPFASLELLQHALSKLGHHNVNISGKGTHKVVYAAAENNNVYAFDAETNTGNGGLLWGADQFGSAHAHRRYLLG